jgi:DNA-binding NtrC family response regulator
MDRILLVEDDRNVRLLLEHVLISEGYDVTAVETVASACSLLDEVPFDLVVADGILADGNGVEVAEKAAQRDTKALIITGNALHLPAERLRNFDYLLKPVRPDEMIDAVRRCLDGRAGDR